MNNCWTEPFPVSYLLDYVIPFVAIIVSILSVIYSVLYNRRTLKLTEEHNKKSVEPKIFGSSDVMIYLNKEKASIIAYNVNNGGVGPAIIKSCSLKIENQEFTDIFRLLTTLENGHKYDPDKSLATILEKDHVIVPNESIKLFELHVKDILEAKRYSEILKNISLKIEYENIYGEERLLIKDFLYRAAK